jgi:hypothetical protein
MKKAFKYLKQLSVEGCIDKNINKLLPECEDLERLEIQVDEFCSTFSTFSESPLKLIDLTGDDRYSSYFFDFNNTLEVLSLYNVCIEWRNVESRGYTNLTTLIFEKCSGITNSGLGQIATYCENLTHFEIETRDDLSEGVLQIFETRSILKFVSHNYSIRFPMMEKAALQGNLQEFTMISNCRQFDYLYNNLNNIRCVEHVCRHNKLEAIEVSPGPIIADVCLGLIADYCQEGLQQLSISSGFTCGSFQQLSISSGFTCESFLQKVMKPGNMAIRGIRFLTLPDIALTNDEFQGVSEAFIDIRYLVFSGKNITDIGLLPLVRSFRNLESITINDAYKITGCGGRWLFLHTHVKLKYIQVTNLRAQSVEFFMRDMRCYHSGVIRDVEIVNLDMIENGEIINHASCYGYESKYPLPGGYVSKFDKLSYNVYD